MVILYYRINTIVAKCGSELFIKSSPSVEWNTKLKDRTRLFSYFFFRSPYNKSTSCEYRNKLTRRGARLVLIGIPIVCRKTRPSIKHPRQFDISFRELLFQIKICTFLKQDILKCVYTTQWSRAKWLFV